MASNWIQARQTKYGLYLTVYVVVVLAVLGALNWLADQNNKSFDTTTNKQFSLSDQTVKTVKNLKSDVNLTYFDKTSRFGSARDLLERYSNLSRKLHVAYVDPDKKPDVAKADGFRTMGGVVVQNGVKTEEAGALTEEGLTNAIIRVVKTVQKTVCFATGSGEASLADTERGGLSFAKEQLEKNTYKTSGFALIEKAQIPADCAAVIIAGPRRDYTADAIAALKKFVEDGGHVLFAIDPALEAQRAADALSGSPEVSKMLEGWGVTLNKDLVLDPRGRLFGFSEVAPLVTAYEAQPIVRDLKGLATVFPLSRSLTVGSGKSIEKLFSSSDNAVTTTNLKPPISVDPATAPKGPFVLAVSGTIGSGAKQGRFIVIGSSTWMNNSTLQIAQIANRDLFLNTVNWLTADEDLISIRPKNPEDRRVSLTRSQSGMMFFSTVVFLPMLVILSGIAVWWKRR